MRTALPVSLLVIVVVAGLSCTFKVDDTTGKTSGQEAATAAGETTTPGPEPVEVVAMVVGDLKDKAAEKITHETTTFTPNTPVIYAMAAMTGLKTGDIVTGTLMAIKVTTAEGRVIENHEALTTDIEAPGTEATVTFEFSVPDAGWPVGSYQVVVEVGGKAVSAANITVEGSGV